MLQIKSQIIWNHPRGCHVTIPVGSFQFEWSSSSFLKHPLHTVRESRRRAGGTASDSERRTAIRRRRTASRWAAVSPTEEETKVIQTLELNWGEITSEIGAKSWACGLWGVGSSYWCVSFISFANLRVLVPPIFVVDWIFRICIVCFLQSVLYRLCCNCIICNL